MSQNPPACENCPWVGRNPVAFAEISDDAKRRAAAGQFVLCRHGGALPPKACWGALTWAQSAAAIPYKPTAARCPTCGQPVKSVSHVDTGEAS